ncbi:MAG: hypothetical protein MJ215_01045 [Spirochaetia bacterium]|nr:hypothetical protein [Spirochaetia bacterium]
MTLFFKLLLVAVVVGTIFFLAYIYPNIKTPKWQRKIISAKYLRDRQHFDLADGVLEGAIKEFPTQTRLYHVYHQYYSTPDDMKKIFDIFSSGYEKTGDAGLGVVMAKFLIEEGETDKAAALLESSDARDFMLTNNMPFLSLLYYRMGRYEEAERSFVDFYKKLYPEEKSEKDMFSNLMPEELMLLVQIRSHITNDWRETFRYLPERSVLDEDDWNSLLKKLKDEKSKITVTSGIYGPVENLFAYRTKMLDEQVSLIQTAMKN